MKHFARANWIKPSLKLEIAVALRHHWCSHADATFLFLVDAAWPCSPGYECQFGSEPPVAFDFGVASLVLFCSGFYPFIFSSFFLATNVVGNRHRFSAGAGRLYLVFIQACYRNQVRWWICVFAVRIFGFIDRHVNHIHIFRKQLEFDRNRKTR